MNETFKTLIQDPEVVASMITGFTSMLTALVPTVVVYQISKRFLGNKRYIRMAVYAMREIQVLRALVAELSQDDSDIRKARKAIFQEQQLKTENRFTPKQLEQKLASYEEKLDESLSSIDSI